MTAPASLPAGPYTFSLVETVGPNRQLRVDGNLSPGMSRDDLLSAFRPLIAAYDALSAAGAVEAFEQKRDEIEATLREQKGNLALAQKTLEILRSKDRPSTAEKQQLITEENNVLRWISATEATERALAAHIEATTKVKGIAAAV